MTTPRFVARGSHTENSTGGTFTFRVAADAGSNHALVVRLYNRGNLASPSVTFNGDACTLVIRDGARSDNNARWAAIFVLVAPDAGDQTVSVSWGSGTAAVWHCIVEHWCDVDQTTPYGTAASRNANGTTTTGSSIDVTSATGDMVIDAIAALDTISVGSGQTAGPKYTVPGSHMSSETAAGSTTTMDWTWSSASSSVGHVGVALKGAGSSSSETWAEHSGTPANKSWLIGSRTTAESATTGQTLYGPLAATVEMGTGGVGAETPWLYAGEMHIGIKVSANATTSASTLTLMVDGVASSTTVTIPSGTTGEFVSSTATDLDGTEYLSWKLENGGGGTLSFTHIHAWFTPDDTDLTVSKLATHSSGSASFGAGLTRYFPGNGARVVSTTLSGHTTWFAADGTLRNLQALHSNQTRDFVTTVTTLIDEADTDLELSIDSTEDNSEVDTSGVAVAYGERVQHRVVTASGTGNYDGEAFFLDFESAANEWVMSCTNSQLVLTNATDQWLALNGELAAFSSESAATLDAPFAFTALRLWVDVTANTQAGSGDDAVFTLRVGGADTDMVVRVPRGDPVRVYSDLFTAVAVAEGDAICVKSRTNTTTGSVTIRAIGLVGVSAGAGGYTHPTLSGARMGSMTTTGGVPLVDYAF